MALRIKKESLCQITQNNDLNREPHILQTIYFRNLQNQRNLKPERLKSKILKAFRIIMNYQQYVT